MSGFNTNVIVLSRIYAPPHYTYQYEPANCTKLADFADQTLTTTDLSGAWHDQMFAVL